jgi:peptidoglycan/LPS O-acetylase OafA/YrhL
MATRSNAAPVRDENKILRQVALALVALAAVSSIVLLAGGSPLGPLGRRAELVSALPLLAIGVSFLIVQCIVRPQSAELLKNVLLAATFLLWGVVQLMEQSPLSKKLGDLVIVLYVVDLGWTILNGVNRTRKPLD